LNLILELVTAITVEVNVDNFVTNPKQELSWKLGQHIETKNHLFFFFSFSSYTYVIECILVHQFISQHKQDLDEYITNGCATEYQHIS